MSASSRRAADAFRRFYAETTFLPIRRRLPAALRDDPVPALIGVARDRRAPHLPPDAVRPLTAGRHAIFGRRIVCSRSASITSRSPCAISPRRASSTKASSGCGRSRARTSGWRASGTPRGTGEIHLIETPAGAAGRRAARPPDAARGSLRVRDRRLRRHARRAEAARASRCSRRSRRSASSGSRIRMAT